jgi:hypothetical protein
MAYQLSTVIPKVQARVRDSAYSTTEITDYLNDTINDVFNEYRLTFMQTTQTYTVTVGVSDITNGSSLPTNYVEAINLTLTTAGSEMIIPYQDFTQIDAQYPDPDDITRNPKGAPRYWYFYANTIKLFPAPDLAYTLSLRYYKKPTTLSSDADIPEIPSQFEELLVVGAGYRVLQVKDQYDQAGVLQNKYDEILQKLVVRYGQHQVGVPNLMRINRAGGSTRRIDSYHRVG